MRKQQQQQEPGELLVPPSVVSLRPSFTNDTNLFVRCTPTTLTRLHIDEREQFAILKLSFIFSNKNETVVVYASYNGGTLCTCCIFMFVFVLFVSLHKRINEECSEIICHYHGTVYKRRVEFNYCCLPTEIWEFFFGRGHCFHSFSYIFICTPVWNCH